ncbi:MAG: hypothetical protein AAFR59_17345, partial [Bacteroidota bacterium]
MKSTIFSLLLIFFIQACTLPANESSQAPASASALYFGQKVPGTTPEKFAPGLISLPNRYEYGSTFSKDGKVFFLGVDAGNQSEIYTAKLVGEEWTELVKILDTDPYSHNDPMLSPDEQRLYYISNRPTSPTNKKAQYDIWYSKKEGENWSMPINAGSAINTNRDEYYISFSQEGAMYFATRTPIPEDSIRGRAYNFDIVRSAFKDGAFQQPERLPKAINTSYYEADVFVAPDESYMIFCGMRPDTYGRGDLYISFKDEQNNWLPAVHMDSPINTRNHELCP